MTTAENSLGRFFANFTISALVAGIVALSLVTAATLIWVALI